MLRLCQMQTKFSPLEEFSRSAEAELNAAHDLLKLPENKFVQFSDGAVTTESVSLVQLDGI
jgi:hypothetical protein